MSSSKQLSNISQSAGPVRPGAASDRLALARALTADATRASNGSCCDATRAVASRSAVRRRTQPCSVEVNHAGTRESVRLSLTTQLTIVARATAVLLGLALLAEGAAARPLYALMLAVFAQAALSVLGLLAVYPRRMSVVTMHARAPTPRASAGRTLSTQLPSSPRRGRRTLLRGDLSDSGARPPMPCHNRGKPRRYRALSLTSSSPLSQQRRPALQALYETTLGLRLIADEPFALVFDARGTMLRSRRRPPSSCALYRLGLEGRRHHLVCQGPAAR